MNNEDNYTVYMHISPSHKVYIGITCQKPECRWNNGNGYTQKKRNGEYSQPSFAHAIMKYGWENFEHIILFENLSKDEAEHREKLLVALWRSNDRNFGYNIREGGGSSGGFSEEVRKKMSESRMGPNSSMFGRKHSEETRRKMSEAAMGEKNHMYGKYPSAETLRRKSEAMRGENHPMYGKHHTEETKRKISESTKGKYAGENSPNFGRKHTEEARKNMSLAKLGKETGRGVSVYCTELDRQWSSILRAKKDTGAWHIYDVIYGKRNHSGKHPVTGEPLHWKLVENDDVNNELNEVMYNEI